MDFESDLTLKEWAKDKPLSILQLDPADRAVLRIADERDAIQKKTFTKWVNKHLKKANRHVNDLFVDLQDGLNLISLLEVLSGEHLHREKGRMRFHALQNVELVLNYLRYKKIKLVNIRPEDIVDGNQKLTLGLIWTIILHFQISDIVLSQREENVSPKEVLLKWAKKSTARYPEVRVTDFTQSWRDGLAFNALIHRNRPDLVDWRTVKTKAIRERLENAFYQAEKAGVTRLLDPEDVDTHEIDEKSIITYISSLYDVFPEPPTKHPLYDNESQTLTHEYREVASSLHLWIREYTTIFSERTLPPTLSDLVKSSQEIMRFKTYEIPNKINDKNRLNTLYTELQKIYESTGEVDIEPELHVDVLERNWSKLMSLHQERDQQLQDEIKKFERLDRLAERLSRDCKRVDSRLDDVEQRVIDESKRLERLHPLDAKRNADSLESEMRSIEETIQSLVQDLSILKSVNHQSFPNLERRVNKLHQKWVALRSSLHQKLIARLASVSFPVVEERTVTRQTRTVLETRLVDTNHHFRSLQQAIEWCRAKIKLINESELGNDLAGVKIELSHHEREHKEIDRFKTTVEQCAAAKTQFTGEEQSLYIQHLNNLHKVYSELLTTSNKRMSDLESLLDYLQSLQNQLQWLTDKELIEITRDWSDININLQSVQHYHESLMSELEKREISVRSVLERGNSLILQNHPAGKIISRWTETLKEAWSRLLQFSLACEIHTEATRKYQEYSKDLREAEAWLQSRDELLNTVYSASEFSLDEGERLLKGMQEMREELNKKAPIFAELTSRAGKIPPIRQRRQPITRPIQVKAVCNFTSDTVYIEKDDTWLLHDNSALTHWRVSSLSSRSNDTNVPGVVFFIPPPGKELLEGAERLNRAFESTTSLWQKKHMRLRQNMIFATIRVVRSWDLAQFVGMGSEQRNAIRRALNEDADKLLNEGDPSDPQLRRLRREMDEVNRLFEELEKRARQEDEQKAALREFTEITTKIQTNLDEYERTLNQRILNTIPRDPHSLERLVLQHKDFENDLKSMTTDIENIQLLYNTLPRKNSVNTTKVENILQQWNQIWNYSHLYVERLKCVEIVLSSLDEARNVVSELEIKLASFGEMPSDIDNLRDLHDDLVRLQNAIAARQPIVDQLIDDATNVRRVVVRSRDRTSEREHNDLDRLDDDVNSVTRRWNDLCANLVDRLRSCESAYSILDNFGQTYQTEVKFIDESYKQLNELPPVSHAKHHIEPTKVLFTSIVERTQPLEQVNIDGGRFIREAKIFAVELRRYADEVTKSNPSFEKPESTQEIELQKIEQKLDNVNQKFLTLVTVMQDRIRQMAALTNDKELQEFVRGMKPAQLRTFRTVFSIAETTKQIANKWLPDTCDMGNQMNGSQPENPDIISEPCMTDGSGQIITVGEAIRTRRLDVRNGTIRFGPSTYTISQASSLGLINPSLSTRLLSQLDNIRRELYHAENPVSLTDLIRLRISDGHTVLDRRKGIYVNIKNALNLKLLDNIHEIYGPTHKITLKDSNFKYNIKNLQKPLSLKEALDLNMINDDHIVTKYGPMTLKQAYESYILDPNQKNILNHQNQLISLTEALDTGLIHDMKYSGIPLKQAYDYLYTVSILSIFDIPFISIQNDELNPKMSKCVLSGFKNDELNLKNDELNLKNDELNLKNDELNAKIFLTLRQTIEYNIFHNGSFLINNILHSMDEIEVNSEVKNILNTKIGIFSFGKELTAFEAVSLGVLDIETGLLKIKKGLIGYEEALKKNIITKKGVNELKKMLMIVVTTKTNTIFEYPDTTNHNTTNKMIKFFNKISMKETGNDKFDTHVISGNDKIEIDEINFSSTKMIKFLNVLSMKETGNDKFDTQNVISGAGNDKMETDEINFSGNKMIKFLNVLSMKETGNDQNFLKAGNDLETISFIDDTSGYDNGSKAGNDEFNPKNVIYGAGRNDKIIMESTPSGAGNDKSSIKNVISEARKDELNIKLLQNVQFKAGNDKLNTNNYQSVLFDGGNDKFNTINVICKAKNDKHVLFAAGNNKLSTQNIIYGAKYDKSVLLGAGNEKCSTQNVIFGAGNDKLSTQNAIFGAGNDMLRTQNAISGAGNDKFDSQNVIPGAKNDKSVLFGAGNDKLNTQNISGPKNDKNVLLGAGNDKCSTQNVISGAGNDKLSTKNAIFGAGNDVLSTQNAILGAGNDKFDTQNVIPGAKDDKSVLFGAGNDKLNTQNTSGSTNDKSDLFEAGNDKYSAQNVISGAGNYKLSTQNAISGAGNDILNTQNFISGAKYDKSVLFEAGNDKFSTQNVIFGAGNDKLSTQNAIFGAGNDKFNTQNVIPGAKNDKSVLFEAGNDKFTTQNFISGAGNDKLSTQNAIFGAGNDKLSTQNVISGAGNDKFNTQNVIPGAKNDKSFLFRAVNHKFSIQNVISGYDKRLPIKLSDAVQNEENNFYDPIHDKYITLRHAVESGLLDISNYYIQNNLKSIPFDYTQYTSINIQNMLLSGVLYEKNHKISFKDALNDIKTGFYKNIPILDAVKSGILDPNTIVYKDALRRRFVTIDEAFKRGLCDKYGRVNSIDIIDLIDDYVYIDKIDLSDAIDYMYDIISGLFNNPFNKSKLNLKKCLTSDLICDRSSMIKYGNNLLSIKTALNQNILKNEGLYLNMDLVKAKNKGYIVRTSRQAMEEKYKLSDDTLRQLLEWMSELEEKLSRQEPAQERLEGIREQINRIKLIKEELDSQTSTVQICLDEARHVALNGAEYLSRDEISHLERNSKSLKTRFDRATSTTDKLLRRINAAYEELNKYRAEASIFSDWLDKTTKIVIEKENTAHIRGENITELLNDVISRQADLRFITMAGQKFSDESKDFLTIVNEFRLALTSRPGLIEPYQISEIKKNIQEYSKRYKDLSNRVSALNEKLSGLGGRQREYKSALERVRVWLSSAEPRATKILSEPLAADPHSLEEQLTKTKSINNEFIAQNRLFEQLRSSLDTLIRSVEGQASRSEINELSQPVEELTSKYEGLSSSLLKRTDSLENALSQSQGVENSLENVVSWLSNAENNVKSLTRPASLNKPRLEEQVRSVRGPLSEIVAYRNSIESVVIQSRQLISTATNPRLTKRIDSKVKDVLSRYDKLLERCTKLAESFNEVNAALDEFNTHASEVENWLGEENVELERDIKREQVERVLREGRALLSRKDVTDTSQIRDRIKNIETQWRDLNTLLDERTRLAKIRAEQTMAYDKLRDAIIAWLNAFEGKMGRLEPVALHMDTIKRQTEELKPYVKEHRDFAPNIDKLYDLSTSIEERPESPRRLTKRLSLRKSSIESQSPTKYRNETHEITEINTRYANIGLKLNERSIELDQIREELRKSYEQLKNLDIFLDRINRSLPRDSLPNNKDEADKTLKLIKSLLEDMYEKQSLLESYKNIINDLLKRKSSEILSKNLQDITLKWKNINDICKNRIENLEDLKDFYDSHDHLNTWLNAKERMIEALGPISSDPRMVQSQVEQVQVLREELRTMRPQLSHLEELTQKLVHNNWTQLEIKCQNIVQRWTNLTQKLENRSLSLGAAYDSSREFDSSLNRLRDTLNNISDQVDNLKDEPEIQLRKIQNIERQLEGARQLLRDTELCGENLCSVLTDSRAEIQQKLTNVNKQYNTLQAKVDRIRAEIEAILKDGREFDAEFSKMIGWINEILLQFNDKLLISANKDILQQQYNIYEPIYKDILNKEHEIVILCDKNKKNKNMDHLKYSDLKHEAINRHTRLQISLENMKKYYKNYDQFIPFLNIIENKINIEPKSYNKRDLDKHNRDLINLRHEIYKKSSDYEYIKNLSETFLNSCDIDKDIVLNEMLLIKNRWDKINNDLINKINTLEELIKTITDLTERLKHISHNVQRCEDKLSLYDSIPIHNDPINRLNSIKQEVQDIHKGLNTLKNLIQDDYGLNNDFINVQERLSDLETRLNDRYERATQAQNALQKYNDSISKITSNLSNLEDIFGQMRPPGRDIQTVLNQQDENHNLSLKLSKLNDDLLITSNLSDILIDSGLNSDKYDQIHKRVQNLDKKIHNRSIILDTTKDKIEDFNAKIKKSDHLLNLAFDEIKFLKPIGLEPDTIRVQQEESALIRNNFVEPAGLSVETAVNCGQILVQTAEPDVSTIIVERDCEKITEKWNNLKEKMTDRDKKLNSGLLQSGKFQEALEGLLKWITDMEDMVANQKSPSADYKVVKAQLQEQKFLIKMLNDRQGSMNGLTKMGHEVASNCEGPEKLNIERQLNLLENRFVHLNENALNRMDILEKTMKIAQLYNDKMGISDWLQKTEKKIKDMQTVPTDEEKITLKIREHNQLHDEILNKKDDLSNLTDIASELATLVSEDDASLIADQVQNLADRYTKLVHNSDNVSKLLESARGRLRHLVVTYQQLQGWMENMDQRLSRFKILAVHTEQLYAQMEDLADLSEEISNKQSSVDSTVDAGHDLMRSISSDEAIQLKDKLDSLQRRYNDLTIRSSELLKQSQEALPSVQQFHSSHNKLVDWMNGAETTLKSDKEDSIIALEMDLSEFRPILDIINQLGPVLCTIGPGEGAGIIENLVLRDNRRFDAISEQVQRKAERIQLCKQRSLEVLTDVDSLLEWFREVEATLKEAEEPSSESNIIRAQLKEHKALNDDIASQKSRVRDVLDTAKKVLRESPLEDNSIMRDKMSDLRETMDSVWKMSGDRLSLLEQALGLSDHFEISHHELKYWLDDKIKEAENLRPFSIKPQFLIQDQKTTQKLLNSIIEHKPMIDKLNKTGENLIKLVQYDEKIKIQDILDQDNSKYDKLRLYLKQRQEELEKKIQETSEFSDKLEGMLRALENASDEINSTEDISAHTNKIKKQIKENENIYDEVQKRQDAFESVKKAANDVISKSPSDPAVSDIKNKLNKLQNLWNQVNQATKNRDKSLSQALEIALKFWSALEQVMTTLNDIERTLIEQEPPALKPELVRRQGEALGLVKNDIEQTKPKVEEVRRTGASLMALCGEPDKPEVRKNIEDLDQAWDSVTTLFARREENLLDAMERAMEFHETLRALKEFLQQAESRFAALGPLGEDITTIRGQMKEVKDLKSSLDPMMIKVESLNRQAAELTERSTAEQAHGLKESLSTVNHRWDELHRGIAERYRQLENALLRLGQFQQALTELLSWINTTDKTLEADNNNAVDPHILEVQLAKLKVLMNDISAHQSSVDTLNDAGRQIVQDNKDDSTNDRLKDLNHKWKNLINKANIKENNLEDNLKQMQRFTSEIHDLMGILNEADGVIASSKPVGGLPETASEQLDRFMILYNELEDLRPRIEAILNQGSDLIRKGTDSTSTQANLKNLKSKWDNVTSKGNDKKIKLEIALKEATEFSENLQNFVAWLTNAEKILNNLKPVSRVLETILNQIEEHKNFQKQVAINRENMLQLDKKGTHLKYFSQKQDVILIKNLLISVQHRWERVVSKSAERTRSLDHGYKESKDFHDSWLNLINFLKEIDSKLDEITETDPSKLRQKLQKHKEIQKQINGKQIQYENVLRNCKTLRERAPKSDENTLKNMGQDLKDLWNTINNKIIQRQRNLEEQLLYCGQIKEALDALLDWLKKTQNSLNEDALLHGDLDTVQNLIDKHTNLKQNIDNRSKQIESLQKSDIQDNTEQIQEMSQLWTKVKQLEQKRSNKLQNALKLAEELHTNVHNLLEFISDSETKLRTLQQPEDEVETRCILDEHDKFTQILAIKERDKDSTIRLAEDILRQAHPDAISVIKHWIQIIQSRWDEISSWSRQKSDKLIQQLKTLQDLDSLLEELLSYLADRESILINSERIDLPNDIKLTQELIDEHQNFMENMSKKTNEIETVVRAKTIKERKPSKKGSMQDVSDLARRQSLRSSRETLNDRKLSRSKEFLDPSLPHIGPKFPAKGSKTPEPQFKCARSRLLYDRWRSVWLMSWERQRRLRDHMLHLGEMERLANFSWDEWRKRFLRFMNHKKSRLTDLFRKMDKNNDGLIPREDFAEGIIKTKFDTNRPEMGAVADMFDHNNEGLIDWKEFIAALRPDWEERKPATEADKIHDEVKRLVMLCTCRQKFRVFQVGEGKYRFGDSQKLRLVRILRSTVMVRVGGGWVALEEFLVKNDPCRAKGRTNIELREQFILPEGVSQSMSAFKPKLSTEKKSPLSSAGPITKIREKSSKSVPMGGGSRGTPGSVDSLSDLDSPHTPNYMTPRKSSLRAVSSSTPGSLPGSRSNSRPQSRTNSKPPSRHASNLSLASSDDGTPSRIPRMSVPSRSSSSASGSAQRKLTAPGALNGSKSPSGRAGLTRASSIPTLVNRHSTSKIPVFIGDVSHSTSSSGTPSGRTTPKSSR